MDAGLRLSRFLAVGAHLVSVLVMRDPVAPIPSPFAASDTARGFWHAAHRPPAPRAADDPNASTYDPTRILNGRGDMLGIDRRGVPRRRDDASVGSPITAARHVDVRAFFGLQTLSGWAFVRSMCMSPGGVLVQLFDPRDRDLDPDERRIARTIFGRLAARLGPHVRSGHQSSPLAAVGGCVLAPRVVADLSRWANGRVARRSSHAGRRTLFATLVIPTGTPRAVPGARSAIVRIPGEIVPLNDPRPDVLGVALGTDALDRFGAAVGVSAARSSPGRRTHYVSDRPRGTVDGDDEAGGTGVDPVS